METDSTFIFVQPVASIAFHSSAGDSLMMSGTGWRFSMASTGRGDGKTSVTEADMGVRSLVSQPIFFCSKGDGDDAHHNQGKCLMLNVTFCALATML